MEWRAGIRPLLQLLRVYRIRYLAGISLLVTVDLLQVVLPALTGQAVDALRTADSQLAWLLVKIAALTGLIAILRFLYREFLMGTTRAVEYDLRRRIFAHALQLDLSYYDRKGPAPIMALSTSDAASVRVAIGLGAMLLVDAMVMIAASVFAMDRLIGTAGLLWCLLPLPPALLTAVYIGSYTRQRARIAQDQNSRLTEVAQESFAGVKVVQAYAAEEQFARRFANVSEETVRANLALARLQAFYAPLTHTAPLLCYALVLYVGGGSVVKGDLTIGGLTAFIGYLGLIIWPVMGLGYLVNILQRGMASCERIYDFLTQPAAELSVGFIEAPAQPQNLPSRDIVIQNLEFSYPGADHPALQDLSIRIPAGAAIGITGPTGSGKSTLLRLLLRLYDIPPGQIYIDGRDIRDCSVSVLRRAIGYVPQDVVLFARSIGENIAYDRSYRREEIIAAAHAAGIEEDIDSRPDQYHASAGELGRALSGGQRQRIAIARAIIKQPGLLLLDDIYSALDFRTQQQVKARLAPLLQRSTVLIVSQRISAVAHADTIIVLDHGKIVERGTHEALLAARGLYYRLSEQQQEEGK